jgi:hypothetical protein
MDQSQSPAYRATHVVDSSSYDTTRGTHRTKQVHYVLYDGSRSYIELPLDQYSADRVAELLQHAAEQHAQVMSIEGPPGQPQPSGMTNPWLQNTGS